MNIGVIGRNISDIKLLSDLKLLVKNNYYFVFVKDNKNIVELIQYLIDNNDVDTLILLSDIDINKIQLNFKNILIFNINNMLLEYVNDFKLKDKLLCINNYKIKNIETLTIDNNLINKKNDIIVKTLNKDIKKISYNYNYITSLNTKIDELFNLLDTNINIINLVNIIKYILIKYNRINNFIYDSDIFIYTLYNKKKIKDELLKEYNIDKDVEFINPTSSYLIDINNFSGPLDLLLSLIKESNMNIYDINISEITDQYLKYIKMMEELNINIASSYLVTASELMYLKSNELLPKKEIITNDDEEITREDLINRLIEYKKYKEVTSSFRDMETVGSKYLMKLPTKINVDNNEIDNGINIEELFLAFNKFLKRKEEDKPLKTTVTKKEYSVHDRCNSIKNILKEKKKVNFIELFDVKSTPYIIVSFLSVLELLKKNEIYLIQNNIFDNIVIGIRDDKNE